MVTRDDVQAVLRSFGTSEHILLGERVRKMTRRQSSQERVFVFSNLAIYNFREIKRQLHLHRRVLYADIDCVIAVENSIGTSTNEKNKESAERAGKSDGCLTDMAIHVPSAAGFQFASERCDEIFVLMAKPTRYRLRPATPEFGSGGSSRPPTTKFFLTGAKTLDYKQPPGRQCRSTCTVEATTVPGIQSAKYRNDSIPFPSFCARIELP